MDLSNPYIKDEPNDFFLTSTNSKPMDVFPQQSFGHFGGSTLNNLDPNTFGSTYGAPFQNSYDPSSKRNRGFNDEELLDSLVANDMQSRNSTLNGLSSDSGAIDQFGYQSNFYGPNHIASMPIESNDIYSNTPESESVVSPYVHNFNQSQYRIPSHDFGNALQSPNSYTDSPILAPETNGSNAHNQPLYVRQRIKVGLPEIKNTKTRSPLTTKTPTISSLHLDSVENNSKFYAQPIRMTSAHRHQKNFSGQSEQTSSSLNSFSGEFSPVRGGQFNAQISDILRGTSMPVKSNTILPTAPAGLQSQEMKRRRRRESHNLVERRRRDNINERIQELSHLVPMHRLEDEKVRKALHNNSALSPTLANLSIPTSGLSPPQATSGLAGPGARRAAAGNITTGIPMEEKDKGPNKGDILNGAVSWTRDLMWMLHLKLQQQEELANYIVELHGSFPFQPSEDERRMHTELMDAILKNEGDKFHYSRTPGSGLRVPKHTDLKGDALDTSNQSEKTNSSLSPGNKSTSDAALDGSRTGEYWSGDSGARSVDFKDENDFCMELA